MISFLKRLFGKKPKTETMFYNGQNDNIMVFAETSTWEVSRKIKSGNHLLFCNGVLQTEGLHYSFIENCFIFDSEILKGDNFNIIWL